TDNAYARQRLDLRVGSLPHDRSAVRIERGPRAAGDRFVRDDSVLRQLVGNVMMVRNRHIDAAAIERGAPFHAALVATRTDERVPDESAGLRIEKRVDPALRADADDVARMLLAIMRALVVVAPRPFRLQTHHVYS